MTRKAIFACDSPVNAGWQLGPLPPAAGQIILIGWNRPSNQVDSGIPEQVAAVLARALTSIVQVSFPTSREAHEIAGAGDSPVRSLSRGGLIERAQAALKRVPADVAFVSSLRPETVTCLFVDASFPWSLQGQVALLSAPDADPPDIDRKTLLSLIDDEWAERAAALASAGIVGVLRPGVDGDLAGVLSLTDAFKQALLDSLAREARNAGFDWMRLSEGEFAEQLIAKDDLF